MFEPGVKAQIFQGTLESIMLENAVVDQTDKTIIGQSYYGLTYWID